MADSAGPQPRTASPADGGSSGQAAQPAAGKSPLVGAADGPAATGHTLDGEAGSSAGQPLSGSVRGRLEKIFGRSLGTVKIHTGERADAEAKAASAVAVTHGQDIYFAAGQFQPETPQGYRILAHEVAHTLQAAAPEAGGKEISPAGHGAEVEADAAARAADKDQPIDVKEPRGTALHAFQPHEHRDLGDESGGGDPELTLDDGSKLTFGEVVALADYIGDPGMIRTLAAAPAGQLRIRWTLWFSNVRKGDEPPYPDKARARADWYKEVAKNTDHFGKGAQDAYEEHHAKALGLAYLAGFQDAKMGEATVEEAFAEHYLNDLFAAGHVRTPRVEIKDWYAKAKPYSGRDIVEYMADTVADYLKEGHTLLTIADNTFRVVANEVENQIRAAAGGALDGFSLGDIVAGAYHDEDNEGLQVRSDAGPDGQIVSGGFAWNAIGDHYLNDPRAEQAAASAMTRQMAIAAMKASQDELAKARALGKKANTGPALGKPELEAAKVAAVATLAPYQAKKFIPRTDEKAGVKERNWKWNNMDQEFKDAIDRYAKGRLFWQLVGARGGVPETKKVPLGPLGTDEVRPRDAFDKFCKQMKDQGYGLIWQAVGGF